jgi:hypothetical protein
MLLTKQGLRCERLMKKALTERRTSCEELKQAADP